MTAPHRDSLRASLNQAGEPLRVPGIYDGLSALLAEQAGFQAAFLSGACLSFARFGRPDVGLVTASEVTSTVAILRDRVSLPLIVDIDTGFGNALNVQRTVRDLERAGASALQMEDQVAPKRCGHMAGKAVVSRDEMVGKIKAALDAREDEATMIIARTDALAVNGFDDALDRAEHYVQAGADALFIEAPQNLEQMQAIGSQFGARIPLVHNLVEGGNSPVADAAALAELNYRIALYPAALLNITTPVAETVLKTIADTGSTDSLRGQMYDLFDLNKLLGAEQLLATGAEFGSED
ncbi:MAG: isocitrate lyase/phosphoenolpyruvate mutase family protein [Halieaceae bacterium]